MRYVIVDIARILAVGPFASRVEAQAWIDLNDSEVVANNDLKIVLLARAES